MPRKPRKKQLLAPRMGAPLAGLPSDEVGWEAYPAAWTLLRQRPESPPSTRATEPSLQVPPVQLHVLGSNDDLEWEAVVWEPDRQEPSLARGNASVANVARRLMALERSRRRRAKPLDLHTRSRGRGDAGPGAGRTWSGLG